MAKNDSSIKTSSKELVITRIFDAPRNLVWKAWSEPAHLMKWWGPKEFSSPSCRMDFRKGGKYLYCMRAPDGQDYFSTGVFREIVPMEKIVFTDNFADKEGNIVPASFYGMQGDWGELVVTVTFEDLGSKTRMTMKQTGLPEGEIKDMTSVGWEGSFDKLADSLK